jgi:hypothetical protein
MEKRKAFSISYYDILRDNTISLKGRVLSNISITDKLLYKQHDIIIEYSVVRIIAYKHDFDVIAEGMTCELIIKGENVEFEADDLLYLVQI